MQATDLILDMYSLADLRRPELLAEIGNTLDRHPDLRPERFGPTDPPRFSVQNLSEQLRAWADGLVVGQGHYLFFVRREQPKSGGAQFVISQTALPTLARGHYFFLDYTAKWFDRPERIEDLAALFRELCGALGAYYGSTNLSTRSLPTGLDYERELVDIFWLNYFGSAYRERWGARLADLGVRQDEVTGGGVVIWAAPTPFDEDRLARERQRFIERLGQDTFVVSRSRRGEPGELVPFFAEHQRHAPGGERWLRGRPS